ncbi:MAG: thymidine phosphorylase [Defluviitaleaceae bacterium]|nr:thymidine phosphorylase [Defluviitaleaceae bacterium]
MADIIIKKRDGGVLSKEEIVGLVSGVTDGSVPDYQTAAFLMAVYFKGMSREETVALTLAMAHSGEMADLSAIEGIKADKHSTGGVGDKTTLVLAPIVAACGVKVAKMSGRGLGHTGGTVDKIESIPGVTTEFTPEEFFAIVNRVGACVAGQSGNLAPADKKLYALRDVTGTIEEVSLIAGSIMSKKLASGSDCILLDVKTGTGAFMKTVDDAKRLARVMVGIGTDAGKNTVALITDMNSPLGFAIGSTLEVIEAIDVLRGRGPDDLTEMCMQLAGNMLYQAGKGNLDECIALAKEAVASGKAFAKLKEIIAAQGGDIDAPGLYQKASVISDVLSPESGYIGGMNTEKCGLASVVLGAGRETKESSIDFHAGIMLKKKTGDYVEKGEALAEFHTNMPERVKDAEELFLSGFKFQDTKPAAVPLIYGRVTKEDL